MFNHNINKYGLHDCSVKSLVVQNDSIELLFKGLYELDEQGKEKDLTDECRMTISLNLSDSQNIEDYIEINQIHRGRIKELSLKNFMKIIHNFCFDIEMDFYSQFNNSMLLKGFINKYQIGFFMSNIKNITVEFYNTK